MQEEENTAPIVLRQTTLSLVLIGLGVVLLIIWQTYQVSKSTVLSSLKETGEERLNLYVGTLQSALERYRYLPFILSKNQDIQDVLLERGSHQKVNSYLQSVNQQAGSAALFVMAADGETICSSNWQQPLSFVGKNYGFRPYFKEAMDGHPSGFFAIGVTTGRPGYFMSSPIYSSGNDKPTGVAVVKVDLDPLQGSWRQGGEVVLVGDKNGVIFLSSVPDYKYRSLEPINDQIRARIRDEKQYHEIDIQPLELRHQKRFGTEMISIDGINYLLGKRAIRAMDWNMYYLSPMKDGVGKIYGAVFIGAAATLCCLVFLLYFRERRLKRISNRKAKTAETLRRMNERLQLEIEEHSRTEKELRDTQQEVLQAGKLAALGQMSAAISHELNQPIAAIRTYVAGGKKFIEQKNEQRILQNLDMIDDLTSHMGSITSQLKTFARKSEGVVELVNLQDRISRVKFLLDAQIELESVDLELDICTTPVIIGGDPVRIDQVLVNLIRNSIDAMKKSREKRLIISLSSTEKQAVLKVVDTGHGIQGADMDRLFEPFFTTKDVGDGVGLGLSISYGIVTDLGGTIRAQNESGSGAAFVVCLPLIKETECDRCEKADEP